MFPCAKERSSLNLSIAVSTEIIVSPSFKNLGLVVLIPVAELLESISQPYRCSLYFLILFIMNRLKSYCIRLRVRNSICSFVRIYCRR
jgi:hypothetical protein